MHASHRNPVPGNARRTNGYKRSALLVALALFGFILFQSSISAFFDATLRSGRPANTEGTPGARSQQEISPSALQQMQALFAEKSARTPEQRKISSQLLYGLAKQRGQAIPGTEKLRNGLDLTADDRVLVDIRLNIARPVATLKRLETDGLLERGGEILSAVGNTIRARVALTKIEDIARLPEVRSVRPAAKALTSRAESTLVTGPDALSRRFGNSLRPGF